MGPLDGIHPPRVRRVLLVYLTEQGEELRVVDDDTVIEAKPLYEPSKLGLAELAPQDSYQNSVQGLSAIWRRYHDNILVIAQQTQE